MLKKARMILGRPPAPPELLVFGASWCGPCKAMTPILKVIAEDFKEKLHLRKLDIDEEPDEAATMDVTAVPTLFLRVDGKIVWKHVGALPKAKLEAALRKHLFTSN